MQDIDNVDNNRASIDEKDNESSTNLLCDVGNTNILKIQQCAQYK